MAHPKTDWLTSFLIHCKKRSTIANPFAVSGYSTLTGRRVHCNSLRWFAAARLGRRFTLRKNPWYQFTDPSWVCSLDDMTERRIWSRFGGGRGQLALLPTSTRSNNKSTTSLINQHKFSEFALLNISRLAWNLCSPCSPFQNADQVFVPEIRPQLTNIFNR